MMSQSPLSRVLVFVAVVGSCLTQALWGAPPPPAPKQVDVALRDGGVLIGQVVNPQGVPVAGAPVSLRYQGKELVAARAGKEGYFAFKGMRGGVYQIATRDGLGVYRVWSPGTAPPVAEQGALVIAGSNVVRGQGGSTPPLKVLLANPLVIGAVVATAVAVPVAIHSANQHRRPSSP